MSAHSDWLSLVLCSGLVVSEPLLDERWPGGPKIVPRGTHLWFRRKYEHYTVARSEGKADGVRRWVDFVLEGMLDLPPERWFKAHQIPDDCRVFLDAFQQEIRADRVLRPGVPEVNGKTAKSPLLVLIFPPGQHLDRPDRTPGRWKASPTTKLDRLLRETGHELGLVTNGEIFRLLYAPAGMTGGSITFSAAGFSQEKSTLDAFTTLLHREALLPSGDQAGLTKLCAWSRDRQGEVADQLGIQVREGLEHLLLAWDSADRDSQGALLADMSEEDIYEMGLVVMMRLVFLLYAEEKGLLPHGEVLFDQAYGITYMWHRLEEQRRERQGTMAVSFDAWDRLLATARLIHGGSAHPDLALRAHGGRLFDPGRYPALEAPTCRVTNATLHHVLHRMLFARPRRGAEIQRVGYWALTVEQVGYIYEGLLDHRCARAGSVPVIKLRGGGEAAWPLTELETRERADLLDWLVGRTGRKRGVLEAAIDEPDGQSLAQLRRYPADIAERFRPYAGVLRCDELAPPGWRYLTTGTSRRDTGTQYTPESLTGPVVEDALAPQVFQCEPGKPGLYLRPRQVRPPRELLSLKVCDPAMGSGAFLVQVVRFLSRRVVEAWDEAARQHPDGTLVLPFAEPASDAEGEKPIPFDDREAMHLEAARLVAERCVYGVDINPLAVEMGKLSLWLATLSKDQPFTFLDHALKAGDSLLGMELEQIRTFSIDRQGMTLPLLDRFARWVNEAIVARRAIHSVRSTEGEEAKRNLHQEAERAMGRVRLVGDLLGGTCLAGDSEKERADLQKRYRALLVEDLDPQSLPGAPLEGRHPFHWELEFPEVFLEGVGFDAVLGNPPFMGGRKISGVFGDNYARYLRDTYGSMGGQADLVGYFVLRASQLAGERGVFGFVLSNTIIEGDTREGCIEALLTEGYRIVQARRPRPWPGSASVYVTDIHFTKYLTDMVPILDGKEVGWISEYLDEHDSRGIMPLKCNQELRFKGTGLGSSMFVCTGELDLVDEPYVRGYCNGRELNALVGEVPPRLVVDFTTRCGGRTEPCGPAGEWLKDRALKRFKQGTAAQLPRGWHRFRRSAADLYVAIENSSLPKVLVRAQTSSTWAFRFLPSNWLFDQKHVVWVSDDFGVFAALQSSIHRVWVDRFGGTLRSDTSYNPSDCFDSFPMPPRGRSSTLPAAANRGTCFYEVREQLMEKWQLGLTDIHGRFDNPEDHDRGVMELRSLSMELDLAVRDAYGWDFPLDHGWQKTITNKEKKNRRTGKRETIEQISWKFTVSEDARQEILRRLLALNHERYAEEITQGLHGDPKSSGTKKKPGKKKSPRKKSRTRARTATRPSTGSQTALFGGQADLFDTKKS